MALAVEDVLAIQKLLADYNHAADSGEAKAFAECFVDDGSLQVGDQATTGRDALEAFAGTLPPGIRHVVANVSIDGDGDRATSRAYLQVWFTEGGPKVVMTGKYDDTLQRDAGSWRFVTRTMTADG